MITDLAKIQRPAHWAAMPWTSKAAWLMARMGCSYEKACSMLAKRKPKNTPQTTISRAAYAEVMERLKID